MSAKSNKQQKAGEIPAQTRQEIEEALALFDSAGNDATKVNIKDLKVVLRALGFEPRKDDIKTMTEALKPDENGWVLRSDVVTVVGGKMGEKDTVEEIERAFRLFDDDETGAITIANLRRVAAELGETVTDDELEAMIAEASSSKDGAVNREDFLKIMKKTCLY